MGYDMHYVKTPDGEQERVDAARKVFYAAAGLRDSIPADEHGRHTQNDDWEAAPANASPRYKAA